MSTGVRVKQRVGKFLDKTKTAVGTGIKKAAGKAGDAVAATSQLSPAQIRQVEARRAEYLTALPDCSGPQAQEFIQRNLGAIGIESFRAYLPQIGQLYRPVSEAAAPFHASNRIRYFDITRWVTDKEEQNIDKLVNIYQVLAEEDCNIALIYTRRVEGCTVTLAVVNNQDSEDPSIVNALGKRLEDAVRGNFPGSDVSAMQPGLPQHIPFEAPCSVAAVSNIASEKSERFVSQSMEKLLDGFVPQTANQEYTVILLAQPILDPETDKCRLYEMYSALSPYATWQSNVSVSDSASIMSMSNMGVNAGLNFSFGLSNAINTGVNTARQIGESISKSTSKTKSTSVGASVKMFSAEKSTSTESSESSSTSSSYTEGTSVTQGNSTTSNQGFNFGAQFNRSSGVTMQLGKTEGMTQTHTNYAVKHTLELLEAQMKRLEQCAALGMWDFAAYVVSPTYYVASNVAHMYLSLTQGEQSYMEQPAINLWHGHRQQADSEAILSSLTHLQHPTFCLNPDLPDEWLAYPSLVTATTALSGSELAHALNFPKRSVSGLPVLECASFGREVRSERPQSSPTPVDLGVVYHMHRAEKQRVQLSANSLASHTFITGSTGAGKSNTIYHLLHELDKQDVRFLVVEPAKGEYKNVFGGREDVSVYGTNANKAPLLRLNPFSFPEDTHVLEHIDRLVEIFNACWPMYAAMPAVLKDAVEQAYLRKGWDLTASVCSPRIYPTFRDLMEVLPEVVKQSSYSADTQSDYIGALYTRIKSLTNGINGQIFCSPSELAADELFDRNVIVDLSRIGSMETKSLLMGILVMKLQEHRMASGEMNAALRHVTVLEEAHNLLRRTSDVQSQESSNLQGKSVEMIANAIAEMRTYGEGFVIADQAPGLMDPAVIRNTNTKIIMRLPDEGDRKLVGRAASLNDEQIIELAKLPLGIAAVYQNDWLEPVLCQLKKFDDEHPYHYQPQVESAYLTKFFGKLFGVSDNLELSEEDVEKIQKWTDSLNNHYMKLVAENCLKNLPISVADQGFMAYNLFDGQAIGTFLWQSSDEREAIEQMKARISQMPGIWHHATLVNQISAVLLHTIIENLNLTEFHDRFIVFDRVGGIR